MMGRKKWNIETLFPKQRHVKYDKLQEFLKWINFDKGAIIFVGMERVIG